jgi:hypothetical protein
VVNISQVSVRKGTSTALQLVLWGNPRQKRPHHLSRLRFIYSVLKSAYRLDVVGVPSIADDPESDGGGSLSSW